jgi:membrane-associated phospholipid phosphatase
MTDTTKTMTDYPTPGAVARLRRDIPDALAAGAARDPGSSAAGAAWVLVLGLLCAAAGIALYVDGGYHAGFATLNGLAARLPDAVWQWLTVLGDERVAFALALLIARRHPRVFWTLICTALVAVAYSRGLKPLIDAARPPAVLEPGSFNLIGEGHRRQSFPSGHSVTAGVLFGVLLYYVRGLGWRLLLTLLVLLAGLSRVAVGVHWPVDVAAGLAGGLLAVLPGLWLARRSPWGMLDPGVHVAFVTIGAIVSVSLLVDDGGYPAAAPMLAAIGIAGLASAALGYLIRPLLAAVRKPR